MSVKPSIAIVAMACEYPGARTPRALWENALAGRRAFRPIPRERLDPEGYVDGGSCPGGSCAADRTYLTRAAVIEGWSFDRARFRIPAETFEQVDFTHWLALDVAARALEAAGFPEAEGLPRDTTAVLIGNSLAGEFSRANTLRVRWPYVRRVVDAALEERGLDESARGELLRDLERRYKAPFPVPGGETLAGGLSNTMAGRISNHFDLHGGGWTVDGACASSLLAVSSACSALMAGDVDVAIAGGVDLSLDPFELVGFSRVGVLASGEMRVYDERPTGFLPGEGCGMLVLMRQEEAVAADRTVHATIRGWGISSDGRGGLTRPEAEGQILAIRRAWRRAGCDIRGAGYFEGHGTGTGVGDATELETLTRAVREAGAGGETEISRAGPPAAIGSIKAVVGHTKAAAGAAGLIQAAHAVREGILPPTIGCREPHPILREADPALRALARAEPWPESREPRRAGVSSMGFGGINVHLVLEEPGRCGATARRRAGPRSRLPERRAFSLQRGEVFVFSASRAGELLARVRSVAARAGRLSLAELTDLAARLAGEAGEGPYRGAVVAGGPEELAARLGRLAALVEGRIAGEAATVAETDSATDSGTVAETDSETDSDSDSDSDSAAESGPGIAVDPAGGVFFAVRSRAPRIGLLFPGQASPTYRDGGALAARFEECREVYEELGLDIPGELEDSDTAVAQPAIVAASLSAIRALSRLGIEARVAVGHSVGELPALAWAGAIDGRSLLALAAARGRAMRELAAEGGGMLGLGAGVEEAERLLEPADPVVIAGVNAPGQTVLSGPLEALERVARRARERGLVATRLAVSHSFHSPAMRAVEPALGRELARTKLSALRRRVVSTVTGEPLGEGADLRELLIRQLTTPVLFTRALGRADREVDLWIEAGPGGVLSRLAAEQVSTPVVATDAAAGELEGFLNAVGAAFALGAGVKWSGLFADRLVGSIDLEREPRFLANPCERSGAARVPSKVLEQEGAAGSQEGGGGIASPADGPARGASAVAIVSWLVARKADLPLETIGPETRLLADLHLNSISVGEIVTAAARRLERAAPRAPTEYAGASVGEIAGALETLSRRGSEAEEEAAVAGVEEWTRGFEVVWGERPLASARRALAGAWRVVAPADHPLREPLGRELEAAAGAGSEGGGQSRQVLLLWPERPRPGDVDLLLEATRPLAANARDGKLVLVHGGIGASFAKSLALECPEFSVTALELDSRAPGALERVLAEARATRGFHEVRYDEAGRRLEPRWRARAAASDGAADGGAADGGAADGGAADAPLEPDDVLLVTGGGKGIGAECARALASESGARLVLLGRSDPDRDGALRANLDRLARAGLSLEYVSGDVSDPRSVGRALERARSRWGAVTAILHAAGVNEPRRLAGLDTALVRQTLAPKVTGLENLLAAVDPARLRLLVTFGSIIGRAGLDGEAHYALANEWQSAITERFARENPGCRALAVEWSVWSGTGMGERLGHLEALLGRGITPISPERGVAALQELLRAPRRPVTVVVSGRFGTPRTVRLERAELPLARFVESPRVHSPGVELVCDAHLGAATDPYLEDHEYAGERILPAVMMLEAMSQVALATGGAGAPGRVVRIEQARFSRAVVVSPEEGERIRLAALSRGGGAVEVALRGASTRFSIDHARAICRLSGGGEGAPRGPGLPVDPPVDPGGESDLAFSAERFLYGHLLFHRGRFRRLAGYRHLSARRCVAEIAPAAQPERGWFAPGVPGRLTLGDPAARDVAIHAIQGSIPHARLLPVAAERIDVGRLPSDRPLLVDARERSRRGDEFTWDLRVATTEGELLEEWIGLRLRKVESLSLDAWPAGLLGPYLERRVEEIVEGAALRVGLVRAVNGHAADRAERSDRASRRALGPGARLRRRPDGRPEADRGENVSIAHSDGLTLAVSAGGGTGCDVEPVVARAESSWRDLLGPRRFALARVLGAELGESFDRAATRVWAAAESLRKAGLSSAAPLVLAGAAGEGWARLDSGRLSTAIYVGRLPEEGRELAFAILTARGDAAGV